MFQFGGHVGLFAVFGFKKGAHMDLRFDGLTVGPNAEAVDEAGGVGKIAVGSCRYFGQRK